MARLVRAPPSNMLGCPASCRWNDGYLDYNQDEARNRLCEWAKQAKHCTLFDFPTKGITQVRGLARAWVRLCVAAWVCIGVWAGVCR